MVVVGVNSFGVCQIPMNVKAFLKLFLPLPPCAVGDMTLPPTSCFLH